MNTTPHRIFRAFFTLAAFWLACSSAVAGTWSYSNNSITHSEIPWVLQVTRSGTNLTVVGADTFPSVASALPLADAVSGYQITSIGLGAFYFRIKMTSVTIPDSVTNIGAQAFQYCTGLKDVTIPGSVTNIGWSAFSDCTGLTFVTISDGVTSIGMSAFYGCTGLTDVTIPGSVTNIGSYAFARCTGLTGVTIPDGVTSLGASAFYGCTGLTGVTIPDSLTSLGASAFYGCSGLTGVTIPDSVTSIGASAFKGCTGLTSVAVSDGVTNIGASAFNGCTGLTSVAVGRGVRSSPSGVDSPFYNCPGVRELFLNATNYPGFTASGMFPSSYEGLTNLVIGGDVTVIGSFTECTRLTDISVSLGNATYCDLNGVLFDKNVRSLIQFPRGRKGEYIVPGSVTNIGASAFYGCTGLTGVTIPDSVTSIGSSAFYGCMGLTGVTIPDSVTSLGASAFSGCTGLTSVAISDGVISIGASAFYGCMGLTGVTIPDSVTSLGASAFYGCTGLTSVAVGRGVRASPSGADSPFYNCSGIRELFFNATNFTGFTASGMFPSFYDGEGLTKLVIGRDVTVIGSFTECTRLTDISVSFGNTTYCDLNGVLFDKNVRNLILFPRRRNGEYIVPGSVTNIGSYAFYGCTGLTVVTIPDGVTSIVQGTFSSSGLTGVTIPGSVTSIGASAFFGCRGLTDVTIPDSVTNISREAFSGCGLTSVSIGRGVRSSQGSGTSSPFYDCSCIRDLFFYATNWPSFKASDMFPSTYKGLTNLVLGGDVAVISPSAFNNCAGLTSLTISDGVTDIGTNAFSDCTGLVSVVVGRGVVSSPGSGTSSPFYNCFGIREMFFNATNWPSFKASDMFPFSYVGLTNLVIGGDVTVIGPSAFNDCCRLTRVTIPDSVTSIGQNAFSGCTGLTDVMVGRGMVSSPGGASSPFFNCSRIRNLSFYATNWPSFKASDMFPSTYKGLTNLVIGADIAVIGPSAFSDCTGLTVVTIPDGVTSIGQSAFSGCTGLTGVTIPDGVTSLGQSEFSGCTRLTSVTIPGSVTSIGQSAFSSCTGLTCVLFVGNAPSLGVSVFASCNATVYRTAGAAGWPGVPGLWGGRPTALWYPFSPVGNINAVQFAADNSGDGGTSIKIGGIGLLTDGEMAGIECTATGPGVLAFDWKVSSKAVWDELRFYEVGGTVTNRISGSTGGWSRVHMAVNSASKAIHSFRWEYEKDHAGDYVGQDCGWVDAISWWPFYTLTVNGGTGDGISFTNGTVVTITADAPPANQKFYRWVGDTNCVANIFTSPTILSMPATNVTVSATYVSMLHSLTIINGLGGGVRREGSTVSISANPAPLWKEFAVWTGDAAGLLVDAASPTTSLTMPTRPVTLTATYRDSIARVTGSYGRAYTTSGTSGGLSADAASGSPSGTPAVKLGGSGVVPDNGFAAFETVVSGSGTVTFWWKVSSESNADYLKFKVDGAQIAAISGTKGAWMQITNRVEGAGVNHILRWEYAKNGSLASSEDAGWVDDIVWSGDTPDPMIISDVWSSLDADGLLTVGFIGERGLSYTLCTNASPDVCGWIAVGEVTQELQETNGVFRFEISAALHSVQSNFVCRIVGGNAFKVHFDPAGGTAATASADVLYGAVYGALPTATRTGYAFGGWWTGAGGTGNQIADTTTVEQKTEHTLYAMWTVTNLPPLITLRTPAANPVQVNEGASVAFSVTASDVTDPNAAARGMSNITWYVDGVLKQETKTGAPNAITSTFTFKTDASTVQGAASKDITIRAVALDKQGGAAETNWTVRVNNVPAAQNVVFKAFPVMALGATNYNPGATASSGLPVAYTSAAPAVAEIVDGLIHIVGAGTAVITAVQPGNFDFKAASPVAQTLTVKANLTADMPVGGGTVSGTGLYAPGTKVALTAKPSANYTFLRWEDGSQTTARSLTMPNANMAVSAFFGITTNVPPPVVATPGAQQAMVGVFFTLPLDISSDSLPTVTVTGLPAGLAYNAATKTVAGVPSAAVTNKAVAVSAKNANKAPGTNSFLVTVSPLPAWAQGTFNGTCALCGGAEPGAAVMTVTALGKISGTLSAAGTNYVFNVASYTNGSVFAFTASAVAGKAGIPLAFVVTQALGSAASALSVAAGRSAVTPDADPLTLMYRNVWKDKDMSAVATNYTGYYTATLPGGSEYGSGYLTFTVDKAGGIKTAGKLADGTAVSLSGTLILDDAGRVFAVLYTSPAAYKGGCLFGVAEFFRTGVGAKVIVRPLDGEPFVWESLSPTAAQVYGAGFSRNLGLTGGWYDTLGNLYGYYSNRVMMVGTEGTPVPETSVGTNRYDSVCWNPNGLELTVATNKLGVMTGFSAPKAGTPVKVGAAYDYTNPTNTVGLSVALTRATGVFKGAFKAWFDTVTTHTSKSVAFEGVLTPERDDREDGVEGRGFFLWPDSGQYLNPQGKPVPYSFSWSYDLLLRAD